MNLWTWTRDANALSHLATPAPTAPPKPRQKSIRPKAPPRPTPWRPIAKLHVPLALALVAYELLRLAGDLQPVVVAAWASLVSVVTAAVPTVLAALVFALCVFVLRRRG